MKNYAKVILYAYPLLKTVGKDYEEHIRNKALLSYDSAMTAERLIEYIAEEILNMRLLVELRRTVDGILGRLSERERELIGSRFFGKRKKTGAASSGDGKAVEGEGYRRSYFREQEKAAEKVAEMLVLEGLTEEVYKQRYRDLDILKKVHRYVEKRCSNATP